MIKSLKIGKNVAKMSLGLSLIGLLADELTILARNPSGFALHFAFFDSLALVVEFFADAEGDF